MTGLRTALGMTRSLAIYHGRPWRQRQLRRFYAGLLQPGDLVFDIGAHVGNRTRALRAACARVVALEPQAAFAALLRATLPRDVTLVEAAVGARAGEAELAVSRLHPTVSSLAGLPAEVGGAAGFSHVRWDSRQRVPVTTLDALIAAHGVPAFVKIDVEGFEAEVLAGLSQPLRLIAFEVLPQMPQVARSALRRLDRLGRYRFNIVSGEATVFDWPEWRDARALQAWIDSRRPADGSADIYARLERADG